MILLVHNENWPQANLHVTNENKSFKKKKYLVSSRKKNVSYSFIKQSLIRIIETTYINHNDYNLLAFHISFHTLCSGSNFVEAKSADETAINREAPQALNSVSQEGKNNI